MTEQSPPNARQEAHEKWALDYTAKHHANALAAIRSALGDAAHMCDAVAEDIIAEGKRKRPSLATIKRFTAAKRCGDAIWLLRSKIGEAQAGDTRSDKTVGLGPQGENAVGEADAPKESRP